MTQLSKKIIELAKALPATERSTLVDELLATLDQPDPVVDAFMRGIRLACRYGAMYCATFRTA